MKNFYLLLAAAWTLSAAGWAANGGHRLVVIGCLVTANVYLWLWIRTIKKGSKS